MNPDYFPQIPVMQLRPGCIVLYDQHSRHFSRDREPAVIADCSDDTGKLYTGKLTDFAKRNIKFAINLLVAQAKWKEVINPATDTPYKFKVNFITLTLSAKQGSLSDKTIKNEMLSPWIRVMRDTFNLRSYVWRAERQQNGNIHFHFVTDTYILYSDIRDNWNHQQAKFHFIDDFRNKNKSEFPNSTDVHSVIHIRNLAAYLVKYMSKNERALDTIEGKIWDCSSNLKTKERAALVMSSSDFKMVDELHKSMPDRFIKQDNCTIIRMSENEMSRFLPSEHRKLYREWLQSVYDAAPVSRYINHEVS